jgi:hypothetical protein
VLVLAAYLFGNSLRADTPASLAPAPVASNPGFTGEARAVAPSALSASSLDARGARTILAAERAAALAAHAQRGADFHAEQNAAVEAARWAAVAAADKDLAIFYSGVNATNDAAAEAARWAAVAAADKDLAIFYRGVNATNAAADQARSAAADPYQNEWMGFTSPESVQPRLSNSPSLAARLLTSIKPEGIRPASVSGADELPWIKPEGIKVPGTP